MKLDRDDIFSLDARKAPETQQYSLNSEMKVRGRRTQLAFCPTWDEEDLIKFKPSLY